MTARVDAAVGLFDVTMAVFTDDSYLTAAEEDFEIAVSDDVYVGMVLDQGEFNVQARTCWVTPDNNAHNTIKYLLIENGCVNVSIFKLLYNAIKRNVVKIFK